MAATIDRVPRRTLRDAGGIGIAVGVYGISFGVLAVAAGLSPAQACVMSMLTFTGASQLAFVGVLAAGGGAPAALGPAVILALRNARKLGPRVHRVLDLVPVPLLAALILVQTFSTGHRLVLDARVPALAVAAVLVWRRAPFLVVVLAAAAMAAALRALA